MTYVTTTKSGGTIVVRIYTLPPAKPSDASTSGSDRGTR